MANSMNVAAQMSIERELFVRDTGRRDAPCVLYLHGGPGYNSWTFEASMTDTLLTAGYRIVTYDQRGCGRSHKASQEEYTFDIALSDIDTLFSRLHVQKMLIVGHSFGGTLAMKWASLHPEQVLGVLLIGAPLSYPNSLGSIRALMSRADPEAYPGLAQTLAQIPAMDTASALYFGTCASWAMKLGAYSCKTPTELGKRTSARMKTEPNRVLASNMMQAPFVGFVNNERYTTLDLTSLALECSQSGIPITLLLGTEDGLFDAGHRQAWERILTTQRMQNVEHASHSVFIDRPDIVYMAIRKFPY